VFDERKESQNSPDLVLRSQSILTDHLTSGTGLKVRIATPNFFFLLFDWFRQNVMEVFFSQPKTAMSSAHRMVFEKRAKISRSETNAYPSENP